MLVSHIYGLSRCMDAPTVQSTLQKQFFVAGFYLIPQPHATHDILSTIISTSVNSAQDPLYLFGE